MRNICVFGAGAVGGYLAATLARAGRDVSIVARGEHGQKIQDNGLKITSDEESFVVHPAVSDSMADLPPADVVIVTAKTTAHLTAAEAIAPHIGKDVPVIFAANGVFWFYADGFDRIQGMDRVDRLDPQGILHDRIGAERAYGVIIRSPNQVIEPGHVHNVGGGKYQLGSALENPEVLAELHALLNVPGAEFSLSENLRLDMWRKLVRNIAVALLCVPVQCSPGLAFGDPDVRPIAVAIMREALQVAQAHGFSDVLNPEEEADGVAKMTAMKPSIVQDLELGRPMELDSQVLVVQDYARLAGISTPVIDTLVPLVVLRARDAGAYPQRA